ncbi:MarR family transcriptional regulator [Sphingomonas sp. PL-96]|uniref:MarR family winged helix-turn-helix transcriptional regulator n=1 Tax=Sphingomonas sp. PL-96 TaxID=2887201 RepID=UPI001E414442|nr:MarR family transcriptional regulator [Sphingomonas sp. PL-96]MCC2977421.1 MarR family transcriptional regulator [Sphingomonas sp. PL-96]
MTEDSLLPLEEHLCYGLYSASMAVQRLYKPLLDTLGITYPQYLVLNILGHEDSQPVGRIAEQLALESSTLTPLLKRLEAAELVGRTRNPDDERQVLIALEPAGRAILAQVRCLADAMLSSSGQTIEQLQGLNRQVQALRDALYSRIGGWDLAQPAKR